MIHFADFGITFALAPIVHAAVAWRFGAQLRRRRRVVLLVIASMFVATFVALYFGTSFVNHLLNLAWELVLLAGIWSVPTVLGLRIPERLADVWIVDTHRCIAWMPVLVTRVGSIELAYRTAKRSELHVDWRREGESDIVIAYVDGGDRAELRVP